MRCYLLKLLGFPRSRSPWSSGDWIRGGGMWFAYRLRPAGRLPGEGLITMLQRSGFTLVGLAAVGLLAGCGPTNMGSVDPPTPAARRRLRRHWRAGSGRCQRAALRRDGDQVGLARLPHQRRHAHGDPRRQDRGRRRSRSRSRVSRRSRNQVGSLGRARRERRAWPGGRRRSRASFTWSLGAAAPSSGSTWPPEPRSASRSAMRRAASLTTLRKARST